MVVFGDTELSRRQRLFPVIGLDRFRRVALAVRYRQRNIIFVYSRLNGAVLSMDEWKTLMLLPKIL